MKEITMKLNSSNGSWNTGIFSGTFACSSNGAPSGETPRAATSSQIYETPFLRTLFDIAVSVALLLLLLALIDAFPVIGAVLVTYFAVGVIFHLASGSDRTAISTATERDTPPVNPNTMI